MRHRGIPVCEILHAKLRYLKESGLFLSNSLQCFTYHFTYTILGGPQSVLWVLLSSCCHESWKGKQQRAFLIQVSQCLLFMRSLKTITFVWSLPSWTALMQLWRWPSSQDLLCSVTRTWEPELSWQHPKVQFTDTHSCSSKYLSLVSEDICTHMCMYTHADTCI